LFTSPNSSLIAIPPSFDLNFCSFGTRNTETRLALFYSDSDNLCPLTKLQVGDFDMWSLITTPHAFHIRHLTRE